MCPYNICTPLINLCVYVCVGGACVHGNWISPSTMWVLEKE